jgi:hypothetical protein
MCTTPLCGLFPVLLVLVLLHRVSPADAASCSLPKPPAVPSDLVLRDHQVGLLLGKCLQLNDCSGHGLCQPSKKTCECMNGWGSSSDVTTFRSADCSTRTRVVSCAAARFAGG